MAKPEVDFLGITITREGIKTQIKKIQQIDTQKNSAIFYEGLKYGLKLRGFYSFKERERNGNK